MKVFITLFFVILLSTLLSFAVACGGQNSGESNQVSSSQGITSSQSVDDESSFLPQYSSVEQESSIEDSSVESNVASDDPYGEDIYG